MLAWMPFIVLVLLGPFFFALAKLLRLVSHRRGSDRRKVTQQVVAFIGMLVLAGLYIPLLPRVGVVWAFDVVMVTIIVWTVVVGIVIFGEPDDSRR
jgi:hypothetical protein